MRALTRAFLPKIDSRPWNTTGWCSRKLEENVTQIIDRFLHRVRRRDYASVLADRSADRIERKYPTYITVPSTICHWQRYLYYLGSTAKRAFLLVVKNRRDDHEAPRNPVENRRRRFGWQNRPESTVRRDAFERRPSIVCSLRAAAEFARTNGEKYASLQHRTRGLSSRILGPKRNETNGRNSIREYWIAGVRERRPSGSWWKKSARRPVPGCPRGHQDSRRGNSSATHGAGYNKTTRKGIGELTDSTGLSPSARCGRHAAISRDTPIMHWHFTDTRHFRAYS